jgi:hypothetical protein
MPAKKLITDVMHPGILERAGLGLNAQEIAAWVFKKFKVKIGARAIQKHLANVRDDRRPIAQAFVQEKLAKTLTADLDAVEGIIDRARKDEVSAGKVDDAVREIERIAFADPGRLYDETGQLLPLAQIPEEVRRALSSFDVVDASEHTGEIVKPRFWDKGRAIDRLIEQRTGVRSRELALKARDQQLRALTLRIELSGAAGNKENDSEATRARLLAKLKAAGGD